MTINLINSDSYQLAQEPCFHEEDRELLLHAPDRELMEIVMKYGKNSLRVSSLHLAVIHQDLVAVECLLKAGAKVTQEILEVANRLENIELLYVLQEMHPSPNQYRCSVVKSESILKTTYALESDQGDAYVTKGRFGGNYELRNKDLNIEAIGKVRLGSRGQEPTWDKSIDLYDLNDVQLGLFVEESIHTKDAMVSFYDDGGEKLAFAYYEEGNQEILLVASNNYAKVIARIVYENSNWKVSVYQGQNITLRAMQLFVILAIEALRF